MDIYIDTREKERAITKIVSEFDKQGVNHDSQALYVGDYQNLDNPRLIIDRKQNLSEVCNNVCKGHIRFRNELIRANKMGIKLVILVEHGRFINSIDDVELWQNPRLKISPKATTGKTLAKTMRTYEEKYGVKFLFCDKDSTGKRIIDILSGKEVVV